MRPTLVLLPGLGCDGRLFEPQKALAARIVVPDYPEPEAGETLRAYAARLALPDPPFFLGGVSMGGMLAQAIAARRVRPEGLVLIGTARRGADVPAHLKFFERLSRALPDLLIDLAPKRWPMELEILGRLTPRQKTLLASMWRGRTTTFLRRSVEMILGWEGEGELPCPAGRIHGERDQIIPCGPQRPDVVVPGGGHIISLTHARAVNAFIAGMMG
jgi:pimeloyl-ACP methyl ester carboxylesterase